MIGDWRYHFSIVESTIEYHFSLPRDGLLGFEFFYHFHTIVIKQERNRT